MERLTGEWEEGRGNTISSLGRKDGDGACVVEESANLGQIEQSQT